MGPESFKEKSAYIKSYEKNIFKRLLNWILKRNKWEKIDTTREFNS